MVANFDRHPIKPAQVTAPRPSADPLEDAVLGGFSMPREEQIAFQVTRLCQCAGLPEDTDFDSVCDFVDQAATFLPLTDIDCNHYNVQIQRAFELGGVQPCGVLSALCPNHHSLDYYPAESLQTDFLQMRKSFSSDFYLMDEEGSWVMVVYHTGAVGFLHKKGESR